MPSYASEYSTTDFDPAYKKFLEDFYALSDTPGAHEKYSEQFTEDAVLKMASTRAQGRAEILKLRTSMWEKVSSRHHRPLKVFPFGPGSDEAMLFGTVDYVLKDGRKVDGVEWAARAHFVKEGSVVRMDSYQVYLDTASQQPK